MPAGKQQELMDIAISDEATSTVIHVRGPRMCARMCDVDSVFDKLGA